MLFQDNILTTLKYFSKKLVGFGGYFVYSNNILPSSIYIKVSSAYKVYLQLIHTQTTHVVFGLEHFYKASLA